MKNGHFLKVIYRTVSDSNFINKSCPIFDRNKCYISSFCRFLPFFLLQQPKIWKNKSKSAKKSNSFLLTFKKSKGKCLKPTFIFLFEWVFQEALMIFHSEKSQKFKKSMYLIIICIPNFQMSVFKARQPSVPWAENNYT